MISIPEELIMQYLDSLLTGSGPGDMLHHLYVAAAPADAIGALGLVDEAKLDTTLYAIAYAKTDEDPDVDRFLAKTILAAAHEAARSGHPILFAALGQQFWVVPNDTADPGLADRLIEQGRPLSEHPDAIEATAVYGAAQDGRRWRALRWLTGPEAGSSQGADLLVGRPTQDEGRQIACAQLIRRLVGIVA